MKWQLVTSTLGYAVYELWNNDRKLVTLVFNASSSAVRIEYEDQRRVFLIRKEGFMKNKTVLCNEYGMRIGHITSENNENFLVFNNERYTYSITGTEPVVTIYKEFMTQPFAVCSMNTKRKDKLGLLDGKNRPLNDDTHYSLLLTLCWYLLQPVASSKEERSLELA